MWMSSVWCQLAAESALDGHYTAQNCCYSCLRHSPHRHARTHPLSLSLSLSLTLSGTHCLCLYFMSIYNWAACTVQKRNLCASWTAASLPPALSLSPLCLPLSLQRGTHKSWKVYLNIQKRTNFCCKCSTIVKAQTVEEKLQQRQETTECTTGRYSVKCAHIHKNNIYKNLSIFYHLLLLFFTLCCSFQFLHILSTSSAFTGYQTKHSH